MLHIELVYGSAQPCQREGMDFAIYTDPSANVEIPGYVRTYCTDTRCEGMDRVVTSPASLAITLSPGVRALVGNAGCELTFRHVFHQPRRNIKEILVWARTAYDLIGGQLVLGPMDYDLIHDVMTGGRLLAWAAEHRVPLAIFCRYRFLFPENAFGHIAEVCARMPMRSERNPYHFPYSEVSAAVKQSGAEVWTGAGFAEGLQAGALEKAEEFGFSGVFTTFSAWDTWGK